MNPFKLHRLGIIMKPEPGNKFRPLTFKIIYLNTMEWLTEIERNCTHGSNLFKNDILLIK